MTDTSNTEVPPATTPPAPVQESPRRRWLVPVVGGVAVVAALAVGGVGGYGLAKVSDAGGPPGIHSAPQSHHGPGDRHDRGPGPRDRPERPHPERPHPERPHHDTDTDTDTDPQPESETGGSQS